MRFGVLGPVTAWTDDGRAVRFPDRKVRALLADLLLHAGRPVPASTLIDDLWGEELPANPTATLQTRVSQLRRALDDAKPGARGLVRTSAPGYLIDVAPEALDSGRFRALAARARQTGGARERAATLADALTLWRGPAYTEVAEDPFARAAIDRLDEERLAVQEAYAEARLVLGEHEELVAELAELVASNPLRQRLRAVQMQALHQTGRQAEALASYAELRDRLREELGLDPAADLVALHQRVLTEAPTPKRPQSALPAAVTELIGRDVDQVVRLLDSSRLVTLTGPGGVGKTSLALEAARRLPNARLVELAALTAAEVPRAVDSSPGLLVLDNCEHVVGAAANTVARLLREAPDLRILATSRERLGVSGESLLPVPPLDEPRAVELFVLRAQAVDPRFALTPGNQTAVSALCRRLDGLPLAVELAASRVAAMDVRDVAERFDDRYRQRGVPDRQQTLSALVEWSWDLLTEQEQAVLRRLAPHPGGCTLAAAEAVCTSDDVPVTEVAELLSRLVDRSLVVRLDGTGGSRYRLLETVRAFCLQRLADAGEEAAVRSRYERYFESLAQHTEPRLYGHSSLFAYLGGLYGDQQPADKSPTATRPRLETVASADGTPIVVEVSGSKRPAIVLVGGALNDRRSFVPLAKWLADGFTVATYDRRGRGDSGDTKPWAKERELEDLAAVVELVGGTAYALGVSTGAVLAAEAAAAGVPIDGLILIEPPFIIDDTRTAPVELAGQLPALIEQDRYGDAVELFLVRAVEMPAEVVAPLRAAPLWKDLESLAPTLQYDVLLMKDFHIPPHWAGGITGPALVVDGGQSRAWRRNTADVVAGLLPRASRLTMDGQPHDVVPEVLGPIVTTFVTGVETGGTAPTYET
jgi:predicted ATPase/DNA-binding SARP family transcriptional activator